MEKSFHYSHSRPLTAILHTQVNSFFLRSHVGTSAITGSTYHVRNIQTHTSSSRDVFLSSFRFRWQRHWIQRHESTYQNRVALRQWCWSIYMIFETVLMSWLQLDYFEIIIVIVKVALSVRSNGLFFSRSWLNSHQMQNKSGSALYAQDPALVLWSVEYMWIFH